MASSDDVGSDEDHDYTYGESQIVDSRRYPVHDCCEFDDADALARLVLVPQETDSEDDESEDEQQQQQQHENDQGQRSSSESSSDDNDSAAAAHAAAIGHSPQPVPARVVLKDSTVDAVVNKIETGTAESSGEKAEDTARKKDEEDTSPAKAKNGEESTPELQNSAAQDETVPMDASPTGDEKSNKDGGVMANGQADTSPEQKSPKKKRKKFYCPHHININERDGDENTPLHIAIHARKIEHVKILLQAGANVHKKCDGSPPIHTAISMGSVGKHAQFAYECVVVLTENGADLTAKDDSMHTALYIACMYNLPQIVNYIVSNEQGHSTLNLRSDRSQGRALHAAARFDALSKMKIPPASGVAAHARIPQLHHHHPDGSIANAHHHIPGFPGKPATASASTASGKKPGGGPNPIPNSPAPVTQILLNAEGIEIDATNTVGQTALHVACSRGNWTVARILLQAGANPEHADRRGFTPGQLAHKRGMPIPNEMLETLGGPPSSGTVAPPRDLIVDPDSTTLLLTHELCGLHRTCPTIRRDSSQEPPPENVRRLHVLLDNETGILRSGEFGRCKWENETRRAAMVDVFKCHEYNYVETISQMCSKLPDHPTAVSHLDADTTLSRWSFEAALRAAGSVCEGVDRVVSGDFRNAFCAVRPPGHHAGPRGIVRCENDPDGGSHGFCFLNNVAIGAAYARSMYRNEGIRKVAIVDFDVHHGNGTEEIIRNLVPTVEQTQIRTPFATGELSTPRYRPWLDETDVNDVFFSSVHGYGSRGIEFADTPQGGWFYPASGKTHTSDAIKNPSMVETPNMTDFLLSQTWTRMGDDSRANCCKILNFGLGLPGTDAIPGMQRLELRDTYRQHILPRLREFDPDIIFISAGFDGHKKDTMNFGYIGMVEDDYEWVTEQLVRIANTCCNGRIVSVLEGGYKIHGGIVSPFARSVAAHVRALADGGQSRELYDMQDGEWESQFERHLVDERERKRQQKLEKMRQLEAQTRRALYGSPDGGGEEEHNTRKRKRNAVDYRELYEQMKQEGFAS